MREGGRGRGERLEKIEKNKLETIRDSRVIKKYLYHSARNFQKQPFAAIFQNSCSEKLPNVHRKTPVLESLFNKMQA